MRKIAFALLLLTAVLLTIPLLAETRSLKDDGRAAVVTKVEGAAFVRPATAERWTRIRARTVLFPGDSVRVLPGGPNALSLSLGSGRALVLGPGTLALLTEVGKVRLLRGEVEAKGGSKRALIVTGANGFEALVRTVALLRAADGGVSVLSEPPPWLRGFRSSTPSEWMGSLLAQIDGRDVPLAIRSHDVDVVVKDQIARTRVDQEFVNATDGVLEGVFSFPLPADASISGFGMWIGGELVMADIVERQRARQIYEDIKRRRKDPGLLEWSGGNLFTARVFPIPAHATKRIRIEYTQVLPLEGGAFRYRYALRSEMLRARPLDRLSIRVSVASTVPLSEVSSPTHEVQVERSEHTAQVKYDADGVSPDRDFEAVVRLARTAPLAAVPHVRGDDGYFLLLLTPPDPEAAGWKRDLLPDGELLDLLLIADASGSMDEAARDVQARFLAALLASLSEKDTFRLMAADVAPVWWKTEPVPATEENAAAALAFLAARESRGWSAIEATVSAAVEAAGPGATVLYVGDGIPTDGVPDAAAAAARIALLGRDSPAVFHAVSTGSAYEAPVLSAIASIGGGSVRAADGDPEAAAEDLLREIARPPVKDLAVRIKGIRTARLYPARPPNLPAGKQQILLGRFLPTGKRQEGEVVVTGTRDGKPVRFTAPLAIEEKDGAGNSFLPRLWARRHLDALLAEGRTPQNVADVIALSEEFGIITPYTSFLVLESDEDRERYGVTRRVRMRDGEILFAEARNAAAVETLRARMREAGRARAGLRTSILSNLMWLEPGRSDRGLSAGTWDAPIEDPVIRDAKVSDHNETDNDMPFEETLGSRDFISDAPFRGPLVAKGGGDYEDEHGISWEDALRSGVKLEMEVDIPTLGDVPVLGRLFRRSGGYRYGLFNRFPEVETLRAEEQPPPVSWPEGVEEVLARIDPRPALAALSGGVRVMSTITSRHTLRDAPWDEGESVAVIGADRWCAARSGRLDGWSSEWLTEGERGAANLATRLGRTRPATATDRQAWRFIPDLVTEDFRRTLAGTAATIERDGGKATLTFRSPGVEVVLVVDTTRGVLLEHRKTEEGRERFRTRFEDFFPAGGVLWPRRITTTDTSSRVTETVRIAVDRTPAELAEEIVSFLAKQKDTLLIGPQPKLPDARQAVHEGKGTFEDHLLVASALNARGRHAEAIEEFRKAQEIAGPKPGLLYVEADLLGRSRRGEDFRRLVPKLVALASDEDPPEVFAARAWLAREIVGKVITNEESLSLLRRVHAALRPSPERERVEWILHVSLRDGPEEEALETVRRFRRERPDDPWRWRLLWETLEHFGEDELLDELAKEIPTGEPRPWTEEELFRAFERVVSRLERSSRREERLAASLVWCAALPTSSTPHDVRLRALDGVYRTEEKEALVATWLEAGFGEPGTEQRARCVAAVTAALRDMKAHWIPSLVRIGRGAGREGDRLAQTIASALGSDGDPRRLLIEDLTAPDAIESLPLRTLAQYLAVQRWNDVDEAVWRDVVDRLKARLRAAPSESARGELARRVLHLLDARDADDEAIALLRHLATLPGSEGPPAYSKLLMERLGRAPWLEETAREALDLLPRTRDSRNPDLARHQLLGRTGDLARMLLASPREVERGTEEERRKLSRTERAKLQSEARRTAHLTVGRLFIDVAKTADEEIRPFLEIEGITMLAMAGDAPGPLVDTARALLIRPGRTDSPVFDPDAAVRARAAHLLSHLAVRYEEVDPDAVLRLFAERDGAGLDDHNWRREIYRLLVALDRPDEIEERLRAWIVPAEQDSRWRVALAFLLAETGRLAEAVPLLERAADLDDLPTEGYALLADACLVLGEDERRQRVLDAMARSESTGALERRIRRESGKTASPAPVNEETIRLLGILLGKSERPASRIRAVVSLYVKRDDPRVFVALADGLPGHAYRSGFDYVDAVAREIAEVHAEATLDATVARIRELLAEAKEPLDRRLLHLLEAVVLCRAAEVANAPGPHVKGAAAALAAAAKGDLPPGEAARLSRTVSNLDAHSRPALAEAQLRVLYRIEAASDSLPLAAAVAGTLWRYGRRDEAVVRLTAALEASREGLRAALPRSAFRYANQLVGWLEEEGRFGEAEVFLIGEAGHQPTPGRRRPFDDRLLDLYSKCFVAGGTVFRGTGIELWPEVLDQLEAAVLERPALLGKLTTFHKRMSAKKVDARADLLRFSKEKFEMIVLRLPSIPKGTWQVAKALEVAIGPKAALEFLIARLESGVSGGSWNDYEEGVARLRAAAGDLGDLEPRLLAIVRDRLADELPRGRARWRYMTTKRKPALFWAEREEDFAATAHRVVEESEDPGRVASKAADYLARGLDRKEAAVRVLTSVDAAGVLDDSARSFLAQLYVDLGQADRAVPHLRRLIDSHLDSDSYRKRLIRVLHGLGRHEEAKALVDRTVEHLRERKRWKESPVRGLGLTCLECGYFGHAEKLLVAALEMRRARRGPRGILFSRIAVMVSKARTGNGDAYGAIEAAAEALAAVKPGASRRLAIAAMKDAVAGAADLDAVAARHDAEAKESGLDSPLIRKSLGAAYVARKEPEKAIRELLVARELSPMDAEVHSALVISFDLAKDAERAVRAAAERTRRFPGDLDLHDDLARRLEKLGRAAEAERAWTGLVEAAPLEAESHARLARRFVKSGRTASAVAQLEIAVRLRTFDAELRLSLAEQLIAADRIPEAKALLAFIIETKWEPPAPDAVERAKVLLAGLP